MQEQRYNGRGRGAGGRMAFGTFSQENNPQTAGVVVASQSDLLCWASRAIQATTINDTYHRVDQPETIRMVDMINIPQSEYQFNNLSSPSDNLSLLGSIIEITLNTSTTH